MPQPIDTLIHANYLLPVIPENVFWVDQTLAIDKGRIVAMGPRETLAGAYHAKTTLNLDQHMLMPGLVNAHTHAPMALFRGLADDLPLHQWLNGHIWPAESKVMSPESIRVGTQLSIAEMLLSGTTCFNDHYYFPEDIAQTAADCGIRAAIGLQVMDTPTQWADSTEMSIKKNLEVLARFPANPLITWTLAPQGPYTNNDASFLAIKAAAEQHQLPIYIHLHETQQEIHDSLAQYGKRPLQRLVDLGLLDQHFIAVHMVHLNEEDLALCAQYRPHIVHCPESNMKLASGFANVNTMQETGLNVSLGTDSVASNNDLDMVGEMRSAALMAKALTADATCLPAHNVISMATIHGARALGLEEEIGSLEVGKAADIIAIDMNHLFMQPCYNPLSQWVYAGSRQHISHVWVNGQLRVNAHQLVDMDPTALLAAANAFVHDCRPFQHPQVKN